MNNLELIEAKLTADSNWQKKAENPFREVVSQKAELYFDSSNDKNTKIGFIYFESESLIRIRLSDIAESTFNYFQIGIENNLESVLDKVIDLQPEADYSSYFSYYFTMQEVCDISILAWEQYEKNYR